MKITYDLHIHSALSPCADDNMTPANIVGFAKLNGINAVAIADHNAIANVKTAMTVGDAFGVVVVPAMELQTEEDVHLLCLFDSFENLQNFYENINFAQIPNNVDIFGKQLVLDEDDNVVKTEPNMLLVASKISIDDAQRLATVHCGIALPAHVDREENGIVAILGTVTNNFDVVEFSATASQQIKNRYQNLKSIVNSDAHSLDKIGCANGQMTVNQLSAKGILQSLRER